MPRDIVLVSTILPPSTPYLLAYAVPLLIVSLITTFLGAFLTLDRTRSFAPLDDGIPTQEAADEEDGIGYRVSTFLKHYKSAGVSDRTLGELTRKRQTIRRRQGASWRLEGGIGGVMIGWICGLYLSTFLAILIMNRTSASPLGPAQFLPIWILSSGPLAILGGRWRIAALLFAGLGGGLSFAIFISTVFYPTLIARLVIAAVFTAILVVACLLPMHMVQHTALRTSAALTGAFGMVTSIALLKSTNLDVMARPEGSWANPWLLLTVQQVIGKRGSMEKGLSAAMAILAVCGAGVDWLLKRKFGENPDKEWDKYLAEYGRSLPFAGDREGVFKPFTSFWSRVLHKDKSEEKDILFPPDSQLAPSKPHPDISTHSSQSSAPRALPLAPSFQPKPTRKTSIRPTLVKSRPTPESYSDSSSDEGEAHGLGGPPKFRPYTPKRSSTTHTGTTLIGGLTPASQRSGFELRVPPTTGLDYSDLEEDVTNAKRSNAKEEASQGRNSPGWKPAFLRKHQETKNASTSGRSSSSGSPAISRLVRSDSPDQMSEASAERRRVAYETTQQSNPAPRKATVQTPGAELLVPDSIPATPSLIKAIDRVNAARGILSPPASPDTRDPKNQPTTGTPRRKESLPDGFWDEVRAKAGEARQR